ncbi:hypothetical protein EV644_106380 [Kribbella orskensis]|uniref:Uncharacterized protein n=1 Tax=Kribbella orskensis TaxID=2512216 RepID=A0ABY2BKD4_9ACTN|nr:MULTISPECIES: hypothetical protein [Kribbella]TCN40452.1 hypothetical protein EV642_105380 [Kribbella sp. VKM Ac-2500]TCO23072.1 hypothetical protein EV644_106380 [Kribbella orskensis]
MKQKRRYWPAAGLFFLAPLVAEFLLGNLPVTKLFALFALAPLYGGGAVVIREVARRRGWGYPSIMLLALAFGVLEEGVTTQSLFNPNYADLRLLDPGHISALGMGAPWTVFVLSIHTLWSITVPIVLVESVSRRPREPWLGTKGFVVICVLFAFGIFATTAFQLQSDSFLASAGQFIGVGIALVVLIALAVWVGRREPVHEHGSALSVWLVGAAGLAGASLYMVVDDLDLNGWLQAVLLLALIAVAILVVLRWSRRDGWTRLHTLAPAGGALLTYAWHAFPEKSLGGGSKAVDLAGNAAFAVLAVALLVIAWRRTAVAVVTPAAETTVGDVMADVTIRRDKFDDS